MGRPNELVQRHGDLERYGQRVQVLGCGNTAASVAAATSMSKMTRGTRNVRAKSAGLMRGTSFSNHRRECSRAAACDKRGPLRPSARRKAAESVAISATDGATR